MKKLEAQQTKVDAAVVKADPKTEAVVDKVAILRKRNSVPDESSPAAPVKITCWHPPVGTYLQRIRRRDHTLLPRHRQRLKYIYCVQYISGIKLFDRRRGSGGLNCASLN